MSEVTQVSHLITMKQLLEAGVHFGHQVSHWNPKMKPFIFGARNGIHIIDLQQTTGLFKKAFEYIKNTVADGGTILFVGTKKQAQGIISEESQKCNMPYVNTRWLGGTLTNFATIHSRVEYLLQLMKMEEDGQMEHLPKKEVIVLRRQIKKLNYLLGGIIMMKRLPRALFVVDTRKEYIAVNEAKKLGIPVVAVIDTNCEPTSADYLIPGNDDAIRAIKLFTSRMAEACIEGKHIYEERVSSGEILPKAQEEAKPIVVERKVFVFKEYDEQVEQTKTASVKETAESKKTEGEVKDVKTEEPQPQASNGSVQSAPDIFQTPKDGETDKTPKAEALAQESIEQTPKPDTEAEPEDVEATMKSEPQTQVDKEDETPEPESSTEPEEASEEAQETDTVSDELTDSKQETDSIEEGSTESAEEIETKDQNPSEETQEQETAAEETTEENEVNDQAPEAQAPELAEETTQQTSDTVEPKEETD